VVLARLAPVSDLSFFTDAEDAVARALCDLLLAQDSADPEAWRQTLAALDADADKTYGAGFAGLASAQQAAMIGAVFQAGQAKRTWHGWSGAHVWSLWTRYACAAFYSHPWAWNEIGFGGPAYTRGYKNVGIDARERWEVTGDTDTNGADPVPFADRVERAQTEHRQLTDVLSTQANPNENHGSEQA